MSAPTDPDLARVVTALLDAFPDGPPPEIEPPSPRHEEVVEAAEKIKGVTWRTAGDDVLDAIYDAGPWLTAESFVYWLPALLIDIAADWKRADSRGDTIIYALTKPEPTDLSDSLAALARDRADLGETRYQFLVRNTIRYHEHAGPDFRAKWNQMTPGQRAAVRLLLEYLVRKVGRDEYKKALARWPSDPSQPME